MCHLSCFIENISTVLFCFSCSRECWASRDVSGSVAFKLITVELFYLTWYECALLKRARALASQALTGSLSLPSHSALHSFGGLFRYNPNADLYLLLLQTFPRILSTRTSTCIKFKLCCVHAAGSLFPGSFPQLSACCCVVLLQEKASLWGNPHCQVKSYCQWVFLTEVTRLNCWSGSAKA